LEPQSPPSVLEVGRVSGWDDRQPDCETCKNSGWVIREESWRHVPLFMAECADCYHHFLAVANNEPGNTHSLERMEKEEMWSKS